MKKIFLYKLLLPLAICVTLPVNAAGLNYAITVGTGFNQPVFIMDPYTMDFYSPYYMFNRPFYRNYMYFSVPPHVAPPPLPPHHRRLGPPPGHNVKFNHKRH